MRDLSGLKLSIAGEFDDLFLYSEYLYLVDSSSIRVVHFPKLVSLFAPKSADAETLFNYAFLHNDFLYDADSHFHAFFSMSKVREFLHETFGTIRDIEVTSKHLDAATERLYQNPHPGVIHFEVYKNNFFISNEQGTFAYKNLGKASLQRHQKLFDFPAVQMFALFGDRVSFACAHDGLMVAEFDNLRNQRTIDAVALGRYREKATSFETVYRDAVVRTLDNGYRYLANAGWNDRDDYNQDLTPEQRVNGFTQIPITDQSGKSILSDAEFASAIGNRILKMSGSTCSEFKIDYDSRTRAHPTSKKWTNNFFAKDHEWKFAAKAGPTAFFGGFQTVFGLVMDTDLGTVVLDDAVSSESLRFRTISAGENVKVRHFYRSTNYSHLVASIKESSLEIFSDLSSYFFPQDQKAIRLSKPPLFRSSRRR